MVSAVESVALEAPEPPSPATEIVPLLFPPTTMLEMELDAEAPTMADEIEPEAAPAPIDAPEIPIPFCTAPLLLA